MAAPVDAGAARVGRDPARRIHDVKLAVVASCVCRNEALDRRCRRLAFAQEFQAVDAIERIDEGLRRDRADTRRDMGHSRADREEFGRNRDREVSGDWIARDDGPGHVVSYRPAA